MRLNAKQLRILEEKKAQGGFRRIKRHPIFFILENIYDTYNIGGLFRLADAIAVEKIYLCGEMEIPPNSRIKKASIGTYKIVSWEYRKSVKEAIDDLNSKFEYRNSKQYQNSNVQNSKLQPKNQKDKDVMLNSFQHLNQIPKQVRNDNEAIKQFNNKTINIIAVEQNLKAVSYTKADYSLPLALIFGNESYGVTPETLKLVDQIVEIPMFGINKSLNVIVSAAIVSYWILNKLHL